MRQLVHTMSLSDNGPSFHLWWKENLVKHREVSKYYETDCGSRILSHSSCVQVIGPVFWILDPRTQVSDPVFWVSVYSVIIAKCNKKLWQSVTENYYKSVTGITRCGRYRKVWQKTITKRRRYYKLWKQAIIECDRCKVWQLLPSET